VAGGSHRWKSGVPGPVRIRASLFTAGQQGVLNTGLLASDTVQVNGGPAGADDNDLGVIIDTAGGLTSRA